jgi:hypothetical protein
MVDSKNIPFSLAEQCQQAINRIDHAKNLPPRQLEKEADKLECEIVRLRDALIEHLRGSDVSSLAGPGGALEKINAALSLILTVEYPVTAIQRSALTQARDSLADAVRTMP